MPLPAKASGCSAASSSRLPRPVVLVPGDELRRGCPEPTSGRQLLSSNSAATPTLEERPGGRRKFSPREFPRFLVVLILRAPRPPDVRPQLIARLPEMLRKLAAYTRRSADSDHLVMRCYLPSVAARSLLLATELTLAETPSATGTAPVRPADCLPTPTATASTSSSIERQTAKATSLKFAQIRWNRALDQLSQDIGAPITFAAPTCRPTASPRSIVRDRCSTSQPTRFWLSSRNSPTQTRRRQARTIHGGTGVCRRQSPDETEQESLYHARRACRTIQQELHPRSKRRNRDANRAIRHGRGRTDDPPPRWRPFSTLLGMVI